MSAVGLWATDGNQSVVAGAALPAHGQRAAADRGDRCARHRMSASSLRATPFACRHSVDQKTQTLRSTNLQKTSDLTRDWSKRCNISCDTS